MSQQPPRFALITGAAQRIGRTLALDFARTMAGAWRPLRPLACGGRSRRCRDRGQRRASRRHPGRSLQSHRNRLARAPLRRSTRHAADLPCQQCLAVRGGQRADLDANGAATATSPSISKAPVFLAQALHRICSPAQQGNVVNIIDQRVWRLIAAFLLLHDRQVRAVDRDADPGAGAGAARSRQCHRPWAGAAEHLPDRRTTSPRRQAPPRSAAAPRRTRSPPPCVSSWPRPAMTGQMIALDGGQHLGLAHRLRSPGSGARSP